MLFKLGVSLLGLNQRDVACATFSEVGKRYPEVSGALKERVKPGATVGEEVLGAYEVKGGRPVTVSIEAGQVALKMGTPRPGANPDSPEKMLRKAAAEAEIREKNRPRDREKRR